VSELAVVPSQLRCMNSKISDTVPSGVEITNPGKSSIINCLVLLFIDNIQQDKLCSHFYNAAFAVYKKLVVFKNRVLEMNV
jgi:hypothetical protein